MAKQLFAIELPNGQFVKEGHNPRHITSPTLDDYPALEIEPWAGLVAKKHGGTLRRVRVIFDER